MQAGLRERLAAVGNRPDHITPSEMDTSVNSQGQRSRIARLTATTAHKLRDGRENPLRVAIPAYQGFTSNATAGETETFTLTHSVTDAPVTQSVVVWIGSTYYGTPDAVDYEQDTIDVTDDGTENNVHVYYVSDESASLELRKSVPKSSSQGSQQVYNDNLALVHPSPQQEQPETLDLGKTPLQSWVGTDMTLDLYIDAPYTVRWTDPDGDETNPTNALFGIPVRIGEREVPGLTSAVKADMGEA